MMDFTISCMCMFFCPISLCSAEGVMVNHASEDYLQLYNQNGNLCHVNKSHTSHMWMTNQQSFNFISLPRMFNESTSWNYKNMNDLLKCQAHHTSTVHVPLLPLKYDINTNNSVICRSKSLLPLQSMVSLILYKLMVSISHMIIDKFYCITIFVFIHTVHEPSKELDWIIRIIGIIHLLISAKFFCLFMHLIMSVLFTCKQEKHLSSRCSTKIKKFILYIFTLRLPNKLLIQMVNVCSYCNHVKHSITNLFHMVNLPVKSKALVLPSYYIVENQATFLIFIIPYSPSLINQHISLMLNCHDIHQILIVNVLMAWYLLPCKYILSLHLTKSLYISTSNFLTRPFKEITLIITKELVQSPNSIECNKGLALHWQQKKFNSKTKFYAFQTVAATPFRQKQMTIHNIIQMGLSEDCYKDSYTVPRYALLPCNGQCIDVHDQSLSSKDHCAVVRGDNIEDAWKKMEKNLHQNGSSANHHPLQKSDVDKSSLPSLKQDCKSLRVAKSKFHVQPNDSNAIDMTGYSTDKLPGATESLNQHYKTDLGEYIPLSAEETKKNVRPILKNKDVDVLLHTHQENEATLATLGNASLIPVQGKTTKMVPSSNVNKSHRSLPRRACLVHLKEQYHLDHDLLSQARATKYLVKVRTEISPGRYMAKLELHCSSKDDILPNMDVKEQTAAADTEHTDKEDKPNRERKHFPSNINKIGYALFSSDLQCFSGSIQYPLPNKKAVASRIGYGGNAIVFVVFHAGKEFAVKKTVYRSKEISVHSQLCHPNIINLEAVLIGEKHERHKDKHYVYCFMPKMDINFRNVLSTKEHGCLKHMKMQLIEKREQWELVLVNTKHVLRSVLKALDYMHSQGLVHRDIKASNILIKMTCQCSEVLYCNCQQGKFLAQIGDFDSSATVPGYQLQLEEHQMIRYASVLPLGTMGYRAPEVSMHLVLSGPYEVLYTTNVDIWSFGCLLLTIFIGKSGPLKQRGEASLLLSAQDYPYSRELYQNVIKIKEVQKYYANTPGVCDLVQKCLQVQPHCRPSAKELLQLDFFTS